MEFRYDPQARRLRMRALVPAGHYAEKFVAADEFKFGVEEEYFLSDAKTFDVPAETPDELFETADFGISGRIEREFLQAQIEVATEPHCRVGDARVELLRLRQNAAAAAAEHGLVVLACGTHPLAHWRQSVQSPKDRYSHVMDVLQMIGQRNMLCGMHVHVEFPDPRRRVDVMARILPYLPLFIALSASSPFWQGHATGLKAYRLAAYDELPRTGLPELFRSNEDYEAYVDAMVRAGAMRDASHLWWSIRPSLKYPTLELRAPDSCTRVDDAIAIAALYRALVRYLYNHPEHNARDRQRGPGDCGREQMAGAALRRAGHFRHSGWRRGQRGRYLGPGLGTDRSRRRGARLRRPAGALPVSSSSRAPRPTRSYESLPKVNTKVPILPYIR